MRVIRSAGQNVSPSDDANLFEQIFNDGLFEDVTIASLGSNQVSIDAMYGIMQGRDFTSESQTLTVELPTSADATGYIYVQFDVSSTEVISFGSALAPFTPIYEDINATGTICQMIIAEYTANAVQVTNITPVYDIAHTLGANNVIDVVLVNGNWSNAMYTISNAFIKADSIITLTYPYTITDEQYEALQDAEIRSANQSAGSIVIRALGDVPSISIPIQMIIE